MIKFKILFFICLCFILSQVIGVEKYPNSTQMDNHKSFKNHLKNEKTLPTTSPLSSLNDKQIKKNDKIKMKEDKFQAIKSGTENIQLQKNGVQNSFQSVYDQAFIINDPKNSPTNMNTKNFNSQAIKSKIILPPTKSTQSINSLPVQPQMKPSLKEPIYNFNKRPIVYQCCRQVNYN